MKIDVITLFPEVVEPYFAASMMARAVEAGAVDFGVHNLRDYADQKDPHKTVDGTPYGGGAGMVLKVEPIYKAVEDVKKEKNARVILLSAKGKTFVQSDAHRLKEYDQLVFICGRYEGVDERVAQNIADEEISIGDYVLTGGELGAMVIVDSVVRLLPGVLGNDDSAVYESHSTAGELEHPQYTKPEEFNGWSVPDVLRSGDHAKIAQWRQENGSHLE